MSQYVETPTKSFPAGAALLPNRRVKLAAGVLQYAGASDTSIATLEAATFADANYASGYTNGTVRLVTAPGTRKFVALDAITSGDPGYAAANGKIAATGTVVECRVFEASATDGDVVEGMSITNTDVSTSIAGTNAATFVADADATTAKVAIGTGAGTGDFIAKIVAPTLGGNITLVTPAASGTLASLAGTETLSNKTLAGPAYTGNQTFAAGGSTAGAGTVTGNATALPAGTAMVYPTTAADDTVGVRVAAEDKVTGRLLFIGNGVANKILKVYAPAGGAINGASADAAFSSASGKGVIMYCLSSGSNTWLAW